MGDWFVNVLRSYPELAVFLSIGVGFWIGPKKLFGFSLGTVTATLLAAVIIGQTHIQIDSAVKSTFFIMFIFAVGYGVGPQFIRGLKADGAREVFFALSVLALCLIVPVISAMVAGLELGFAAGLYAGSQTISAAIGVATDQINQLGLSTEQAQTYANQIPIAYAVTYIYGTIGSAIILAKIGPRLIGVDLVAACKEYEAQLGGGAAVEAGDGIVSAYRMIEARAFEIPHDSDLIGQPVKDLMPGVRIYAERIKRGDEIIEVEDSTELQAGDIVMFSGRRADLVGLLEGRMKEADAPELLNTPTEKLDVLITSKEVHGKTLEDLSKLSLARGVYVSKLMRNMVELPLLPGTVVHRGDILTVLGSKRHVEAAIAQIGYADRPVDTTDLAFVGWGIFLGGLVGTLAITMGGFPISLSTTGGALLSGLLLGWLRTVHPTFGRIPGPSLWLMNTLGLNVFIAVIGISAGPGFVAGLQQAGVALLLWGIVATSLPMIFSVYVGHYVFKFHPAILFGACAGARTTTAALGMIQEAAQSRIPALGYGMPYAIGNTLLTIFGMVVVLILS
ncbi:MULTISPECIES: aspartate-alanine antiporter [unclassified Ruegeria]|uniref:aspartate-alanine antiporter n=1 Tax=unclassified Ruegeria TaxID=2625375 RepID=UPI0014882378|nr:MULTISPECIES: aspartate-alanine antiporter [unclassified Ruegeria]NOD77929.1 aspartate-alanine antiporter [Ruegeria sp. HKCCD4332]NOD88160.1 aspartate-alanine antiporter [Ruegeria sp. HKCCD4318]NOD93846.1 aspartate-alanine antiporter [Ruegeria sp. HKCCD4884]NOE15008.1 aspartate-alanine antiporter [Ruegeria sp. HKCCD4318-2]NOG11389.1 aspartate-alanine antiporter [Ruegeria sp. HKCCD4315]